MSRSWARSLKHTQHTGVHTISLLDWRLDQMLEYLWTVSMSAFISLSSSASLLEALTVSRLDSSRRPSFRTLRISSWNNTKKKQPGEDEEVRNRDKRATEGREGEKSRLQPSSVGIGVCASAAGTRWRWLRLEVRTRTVLIRSPAAAGRSPSLSQQKSRWPGDNQTTTNRNLSHTHNTFSKQKTRDSGAKTRHQTHTGLGSDHGAQWCLLFIFTPVYQPDCSSSRSRWRSELMCDVFATLPE